MGKMRVNPFARAYGLTAKRGNRLKRVGMEAQAKAGIFFRLARRKISAPRGKKAAG